MSTGAKCVSCQSTHVIPSARVIDRGDLDNVRTNLQIGVARKPDAFFFRQEERAEVRARVCADCGHVELFTREARALYRAYLDSVSEPAETASQRKP